MDTVRDRAFEILRAHGVTTLFGNPGSTELPFLADFPGDFRYVLGLQEAGVTAMAIGHALASGKAAAVNLHTFVGVGNAMAMIATAWHAQAPLVITAGQQDRRMIRSEPLLYGRAVEMARPYVKWSVEPERAVDVPAALERAYHLAMTAPRGPVFVSIPMDGLGEPCPPVAAREVSHRLAPDPGAIARTATVLDGAVRIAVVAGSQLEESAVPDLVALAERLQAAVFLAPEAYAQTFPGDHPLYQGALPPAQRPLADRLRAYDTVLVVGAPVFTYFPYVPGPTVHPGTTLVQLTNDPAAAARALAGSSVVGDVGLAVRGLLDRVQARTVGAPPCRPAPAVAPAPTTLCPDVVFGAMAKALPAHVILTVEAPSWERFLDEHVRLHDPGSFQSSASGCLGFALPAAIGAALARPDRPVVAVLGDGSAEYTIQGLWTAARYAVPVTFVVLDNREYAVLKSFERFHHWKGAPGLDVPGVDFEGVARGYGLPFRCADKPDALGPVLAAAFSSGVPNVVHVPVDPFVPKLY